MRSLLVALVAFALAGCAAPLHMYDGAPLAEPDLAFVRQNIEEVRIVRVDSMDVPGAREPKGFGPPQEDFFVKPGRHRIDALLNCNNSITTQHGTVSSTKTSEDTRSVCFEAVAGKRYYVTATPPKKGQWTLKISDGEIACPNR